MKAAPFLITGDIGPRAAWLSVFCTAGDTICYLDPPFSAPVELLDIYGSTFYKFVGIASPRALHSIEWILGNLEPRTVIVGREFREDPLVLRVAADELDTRRVLRKIYWHLMPDHPFDEARYTLLEKLRIEARP